MPAAAFRAFLLVASFGRCYAADPEQNAKAGLADAAFLKSSQPFSAGSMISVGTMPQWSYEMPQHQDKLMCFPQRQVKTVKDGWGKLVRNALDQDPFNIVARSSLAKMDKEARSQSYLRLVDAEEEVTKQLQVAKSFGLTSGKSKRVLDLGSGPGYFVAVLRLLGHEALGLEPPADNLKFPHRGRADLRVEVLPHLSAALNVYPIQHFIRTGKSLPELPTTCRFDLVTASEPEFPVQWGDDSDKPKAWGVKEWTSLLQDLACNYLTAEGQVALDLERHTIKTPSNPEVKEWLERLDGVKTMQDGALLIEDMQHFRKKCDSKLPKPKSK